MWAVVAALKASIALRERRKKMSKGKIRYVVLLLVLGSLLTITRPCSVGAQGMPILFPPGDIGFIKDLVLERRGDLADVYFPDVTAAADAFPIVAVLQGAFVDKQFYSEFGTQLARFGFIVVIPNHLVVFGPPGTPPAPFPDEFVILDVLAQMIVEDNDPTSPLSRVIDTDRMGLAGHSAGGATGLFAIEGSCQPPFCFGPPIFPLPDAVRGGAFYGTNTCGLGGELTDPRCIDFAGVPPNADGMIFGIDNNNIPVALVQGSNDGIGTPPEADATIAVLAGPNELIPIIGANHYGITNVNNPGAVPPNFIPPTPDQNSPTIPQAESIAQIAQASGEFLLESLTEVELIPAEFPVSAEEKLDVEDEVTVNRRRVAKGKTGRKSVVKINASRATVSQFLPNLVPPVFPENESERKVKVEYDRSFVSDTKDKEKNSFKEIEIKNGQSASFIITSTGGPFHIDKLKVKKDATLKLGAGTYFVNTFEMKDEAARIDLSSTPVVLHIGDKFKVENKRLFLNAGGSVDGLRVYLHLDAEFKAKEMDFTGVLYGPASKKVEVKEATVTGAIITSGEVKLKKKAAITYTQTDQALVGLTVSIPE
jgi:dienelactone hydrolase